MFYIYTLYAYLPVYLSTPQVYSILRPPPCLYSWCATPHHHSICTVCTPPPSCEHHPLIHPLHHPLLLLTLNHRGDNVLHHWERSQVSGPQGERETWQWQINQPFPPQKKNFFKKIGRKDLFIVHCPILVSLNWWTCRDIWISKWAKFKVSNGEMVVNCEHIKLQLALKLTLKISY